MLASFLKKDAPRAKPDLLSFLARLSDAFSSPSEFTTLKGRPSQDLKIRIRRQVKSNLNQIKREKKQMAPIPEHFPREINTF